MTLLFGSIDGDEQIKKIYVLDYDDSIYSQQLLNTIKNDSNIEIIVANREEINNNMEEQKGATAIIIEKGFGDNLVQNKGLNLKIIQNYESPENVMLEQVITSKVSVFKNIIRDSNYAAEEFSNLKVGSSKEEIF